MYFFSLWNLHWIFHTIEFISHVSFIAQNDLNEKERRHEWNEWTNYDVDNDAEQRGLQKRHKNMCATTAWMA